MSKTNGGAATIPAYLDGAPSPRALAAMGAHLLFVNGIAALDLADATGHSVSLGGISSAPVSSARARRHIASDPSAAARYVLCVGVSFA